MLIILDFDNGTNIVIPQLRLLENTLFFKKFSMAIC